MRLPGPTLSISANMQPSLYRCEMDRVLGGMVAINTLLGNIRRSGKNSDSTSFSVILHCESKAPLLESPPEVLLKVHLQPCP